MSNNIKAIKAANSAYLNSSKPPNSITADDHAGLLNDSADLGWEIPFIYQIGIPFNEENPTNGYIQFDNEDPLAVTHISFANDLYGRLPYGGGNVRILEFEDGSVINFLWNNDGTVTMISYEGTPAFVIGERVRLTFMQRKDHYYSGTAVIEDAQFTELTPQYFTSGTRSLLRNDGLGINTYVTYSDAFVPWDLNALMPTTWPTGSITEVQTQFVIIPSTPDLVLEFEWSNSSFELFSDNSYTHKKTMTLTGDPIYICETFRTMGDKIYLKGNKDFEVHSCVHFIHISRGQ